jgi:hypothetical protein
MAHPPHPLATLVQILSTPSSKDGIPEDLENDLRVAGCMMIQEAGVMLGLYVYHLLRPNPMLIAQTAEHDGDCPSCLSPFLLRQLYALVWDQRGFTQTHVQDRLTLSGYLHFGALPLLEAERNAPAPSRSHQHLHLPLCANQTSPLPPCRPTATHRRRWCGSISDIPRRSRRERDTKRQGQRKSLGGLRVSCPWVSFRHFLGM